VAATGLLFAFITPATGRFMEEVTPAARWIADQPGDRPVVTNASPDGRWSGPRLERQVELMPLRTGCEAVRLRRRDAWLLVMRGRAVPRFYRSSFGEDCLRGETPAFADGAFLVYAPGPAR
jgi:hypothetical protein